jgi:hypothetical protein
MGIKEKQKLLRVYQDIGDTGNFPDEWREAIIVPNLKLGNSRPCPVSTTKE